MSFFHWVRKMKPEIYKQHVFGNISWMERVEQFRRENNLIDEYMAPCTKNKIEPIGL